MVTSLLFKLLGATGGTKGVVPSCFLAHGLQPSMVAAVSKPLFTALILWVLALHSTTAQTCSFNSTEAASVMTAQGMDWDQAQLIQAAQAPSTLRRRDLPSKRPQQPWPYRNFSTARSAPWPVTNSTTGVTYAVVDHAPIRNITTHLLVWWFRQNLERQMPYFDQGNFSLYLMWHPRDHCHQIVNRTNPSLWLLQEFLMANRNYTLDDYVGFQATSVAQVNNQLRLRWLNLTGMTLEYDVSGIALITMTHRWQNMPASTGGGVDLKSEMWVGNTLLLPSINRFVNCGFARPGQDPLVVANKWQQHAVEEFGNLQHVLPYILEARKQNG